jgi:3-methyladenine DNA glycosylase AlkC
MASDTTQGNARKGAPRVSAITPEVLAALNAGHMATINLVEFLAIDLGLLARNVATSIGLNPHSTRLQETVTLLATFKPMQRHRHIARALYDMTILHPQRDAIANRLAQHPSDIARSWASYWLMWADLDLSGKLSAVRRFAADSHFGVREMAWFALRNDVIAELDSALTLLQSWTVEGDPNIRRFACELTRPRGVWCAQIEILKQEPWRATTLLEPLRADPSRYVQNSVANWLNDASKSQPDWVRQWCARWDEKPISPATVYIIKRALRTLKK